MNFKVLRKSRPLFIDSPSRVLDDMCVTSAYRLTLDLPGSLVKTSITPQTVIESLINLLNVNPHTAKRS